MVKAKLIYICQISLLDNLYIIICLLLKKLPPVEFGSVIIITITIIRILGLNL